MQLGNGIYYSTCSLKAQHVSSSMSLIVRSSNCICSLWFTYVCGEWELRLDYGWSPHTYVNQRLQIQLELLMISDIPLETCWAFNVLWSNKFRYQVASCWLFILSYTTMHGSINIKFTISNFNYFNATSVISLWSSTIFRFNSLWLIMPL